MLASGSNFLLNGVLLASAVVPPIVVVIVTRVAWIWAKRDEEADGRVDVGALVRQALWLRPRLDDRGR